MSNVKRLENCMHIMSFRGVRMLLSGLMLVTASAFASHATSLSMNTNSQLGYSAKVKVPRARGSLKADDMVWAALKDAEGGIKSPSITEPTYDLIGMAENVEDVIFNISPTETPFLTMAKRKKATATNYEWQTDSLAAASSNKAIEGDDASFTTAAPTTMLSNRLQIAKKTVLVSGTADAVRKYGRKEEFAYQLAKRGKELKRDIEFTLVTNQASSVGGSQTARQMAGFESMVAGNRILSASTNSTGTTPGYASGDWSAPTDGTTAALDETTLVSALDAAWADGGDPSVIMVNSSQKRKIAAFAGASAYAGVSVNQGRTAQAVVVGGVDLYISDFGEHKVVLNRYMRTRTLFAIDPQYVSTAWLRPIKFEPLAKTGDAEKGQLICELTLVADNPDAHAKIQDLT